MILDPYGWIESFLHQAVDELEAKGVVITIDIARMIIVESVNKARGLCCGTKYIQIPKNSQCEAYVLWDNCKTGGMKEYEIRDYIADETGVAATTIEKWIIEFRAGFNPTMPRYKQKAKKIQKYNQEKGFWTKEELFLKDKKEDAA